MSFSFGIPPSTAPAAPVSSFGSSSASTASTTSDSSASGVFGSSTPTAAAPASTSGTFGSSPASTSGFGTSSQPTTSLFGGTSSTAAPASNTGLFGSSPVPKNNDSWNGSIFGFSSQPTTSLFGSTATATPASNTGGFGANPGSGFGGFGTSTPCAGFSVPFGTARVTPSTSSPTPVFGCFPPQPANTSAFGCFPPQASAASAFGGFSPQPSYALAPAPSIKVDAATTGTENEAVAGVENSSSVRRTGIKFPSQKKTTYRYELTIKDDKLTIWLEDSTTKAQWESKPLSLEDCIPKDKVIPMATLEDYVECFENCLSGTDPTHAKDKDLVPFNPGGDDDVFQLELTVRVQLSSRVLTPKYQFTLYALDLDPIDVLTSRIRDQEDEVESLRAELTRLKTVGGLATATGLQPVYFQADTNASVDSGQRVLWNVRSVDGYKHGFHLKSPDVIQATCSGVYVVLLAIKHTTVSNMFTSMFQPAFRVNAFKLLKNGEAIATNSDVSANGNIMTSTMQHIVPLQCNDELSVLNSGNGYVKAESSVVIYMIR
ncbi:hypothetical protein FI667_g9067, partial [Globisporangium splendens]